MKNTYLWSTVTNKCPRCRQGDLFVSKNPYRLSNITEMNEHCPVCNQATEIEVGFYYGTGYVSYALTVAYFVSTFIAWKVLIGMSWDLDDNRIFYWMGTTILLLFFMQPLLMRLSRSIWLGWFVTYNKDWENSPLEYNERMVENRKES